MSKLVFRKYKILKGINNIFIFKLVEINKNSIKSFLVYNINITIYIFSKIIIIIIINFRRAIFRLVSIKYIKVKNYKY